MPSPLPSSFASAAAGNTQDLPSRRGDGSASGDWSRTRTNGATQTFRRPSGATNPAHTRESSQTASFSTPGAYIPPHMSSNYALRNGAPSDSRYSKDQLLSFYKSQRDAGTLGKNVADYFVADWDPHGETPTVNGAWGQRDDKDAPSGPEICWDHGGHVEPLGLTDMTDDEKEFFTASVNSPLKPPPSNAQRDNPGAGPGRKSSISQGQSGAFNTSSPGAARPGPRRRETGESVANPMSPTTGGSRFFESNASTPPPSLLRRKTDFRDPPTGARLDEKEPADVESPVGTLKRSTTNPTGASGGSWGSASQSANFSPMGTFGAFSLGGNTAQTPTSEKKSGLGSLRGESRFKNLLSKDSSEDISASAREKSSFGNLDRVAESSDRRSQSPWTEGVKTRAARSETNPFGEEPRSGSAALGGSQDVGPTQDTDQHGFSAFGMTSNVSGLRDIMQSHENSRNPTPSLLQGREPSSPTSTNPYQSPYAERTTGEDVDTDGSETQGAHPGPGSIRDSSGLFGSVRRVGSGMDMPSVDRSQTSSAAGNRNFPGLGGLGGLSGLGGSSGWPSSGAIGTPTREKSGLSAGFNDPIFGMGGDLQSPGLSNLGGGGLFSPTAGITGTGSIGRSSKLGALFSGTMQDDQGLEEGANKSGQANVSASHTPVSAVGSIPATMSSHDVPPGLPAQTGHPTSTVPPAQQRTMVMPDRMRWIYRDPQGNTQGPWTGLEMHDWFKAGFFSPDLQIKKLEDIEFEPLAQLVRRIGNSREPFLVPQIGIPHGPEPTSAAPSWTAPTTGSAQPPFPGSFPSFGTTLTAEQQNALERRKQEEQYLMARQKEHLAQQQAVMKQMQLQGVPQNVASSQLQHQSSAQSLHSQPSFGSITSPVGYQPSPIQGPSQQQGSTGLFDPAGPGRQNSLQNLGPQMLGTDLGNAQDQLPGLLDRLNVNRPEPFAFGSPSSFARQSDNVQPQQVSSMLQDRAQLQQEQEQYDSARDDSLFDQQAREERLRQFHALRTQESESSLRTAEGLPTHPATGGQELGAPTSVESVTIKESHAPGEHLSLSQQVQQAASVQRQQQEEEEQEASAEAPWTAKADSGMPRPFPPPSGSPLPAPAAQRSRQNVAESLAAHSRSQTQTPVEAPATTVAPWAREANDLPKGPSLKEIQETEARNAAQRDELAAANRRAELIAEQERLSHAPAPAPGLPSSANWASGAAPAAPAAPVPGSVWNNKPSTTTTGGTKKTLAQIQKEEESRKQRLATAVAAAQPAAPSPAAQSAGKRYADLASKAAAPTAPAGSGAWTTVGAGGKPKAPPGPPVAPAAPRAISGNLPGAPVAPKPKPAVAPRTVSSGAAPTNANRAVEEFTKWAKLTLGKGLNSSINVDDFVQQLLLLPAEAEIISDSVYANSQTLDGRRFAEEFIRRRKLADKGVVDPVAASTLAEQQNGGGWSEVAKKGGSAAAATPREEDASSAAFRVVAPRKKGGKR